MKHFMQILLFVSVFMIPFVQTFTIQNSDHQVIVLTEIENDNFPYRLFTSTQMLETLVDTTSHFSLTLESKLKNSTESKLLTRFYCEDGETDSFNWNNTVNNCKIMKLDNFDYYFETSSKNASKSKNITLYSLKPGKQQLVAHAKWINSTNPSDQIKIDTAKAYITVNVGRKNAILIISAIIGWIYFAAWSISFYPQIWDNFKRKSVVGLNFDFIALNITGFISYSMFNVALFSLDKVKHEYELAHPRSQIPVQVNDVVFAVHAVIATLICIVQCFIYEKADQSISWFSRVFLAVVWTGYVILSILCSTTNLLNMLQLLNIFSYVKLVITIIKYIPQAWYNYKRKSTTGWSIGNIFLDFTGGLLSMCQMFLLAYNYDDWETIFYNFTKFGLGFISIMFDVLFLLQHYVFYRNTDSLHDSRTFLVESGVNGSGINPGSINTNSADIRKQPTDRLYDSTTDNLPHYTFEKK